MITTVKLLYNFLAFNFGNPFRPLRQRRARLSMHSRILFFLLCLVLAGLGQLASQSQAHAQASEPPLEPRVSSAAEEFDPTSLLIGLPPDMDAAQLVEMLEQTGFVLVQHWPHLQLAHVELDPNLVMPADLSIATYTAEQRDRLAQSDIFRYVEFDGLVYTAAVDQPPPDLEPAPNDPFVPDQYAFDFIRAREAWNITHGDPNIAIAVIDTGYASQHADIAPENLWRNEAEFNGLPNIDDDANGFIDDIFGWNWVDNNNNPEDGNGHGTHIFGTIAATTGNQLGVSGLAREVRVAPLRIFGPTGTGRISDLVSAIDYAVQMEIPIINLSLTTSSDSPSLREAVNRAAANGVLIFAASGNMAVGSAFSSVHYPAAYPATIAVAATNEADGWAAFSRLGPSVDIAAPGERIWSTHLNNSYRSISGTSMATAHVSALAGLLMGLRPDLEPNQIVQLIYTTAVDVNQADFPGKDIYLGHGRIDMAAALLEASRGLAISTDGFSIGTGVALHAAQAAGVSPAEFGELRVRVTAPGGNLSPGGRLPILNAMLHYRTQLENGELGEWQRIATDAGGFAMIPVPTDETQSTVELQVGAVRRTVQVTNLPEDIHLRIELPPVVASQGVIVASPSITYAVILDNLSGEPLEIDAPLEITVEGGTLENGGQTLEAALSAGKFSGSWMPPASVGLVNLTARLGPYTASVPIEIFADKPHTVIGPNTLFPEVSISDNSVLLQFRIEDRFGNPVRDGTPVNLFSSLGKLASTAIATSNGHAEVAVSLPFPQTRHVSVWVIIPDGPLEIRFDIPPARTRTWLPSILADAPSTP